ncbi:MAG: hypothetical protein JO022_20205 [Acidobacteriaceae bacterium]|nr:hypothetical protein [Acidobacteriaceae bacterium]
MKSDVLEYLINADDDISGIFSRDELLGEPFEDAFTSDDLDSDLLDEFAEAALD